MNAVFRTASVLSFLAACSQDAGTDTLAPHQDAGPALGAETDAGAPSRDAALDAGGAVPEELPCGTEQPVLGTVEGNGQRFDVTCMGPTAGKTVLLLHGFPDSKSAWDQVQRELATEYRVLAPDLRGYGRSGAAAGATTIRSTEPSAYIADALVADVAALVDAALAGRAETDLVLVGHDWGGMLAFASAASRPERVASLVVVGSFHPDVLRGQLAAGGAQQSASSYIDLFLSDDAEDVLSGANFLALTSSYGSALTDEMRAERSAAWSEPGALTAMLGYYRANFTKGPLTGPTFPVGARINVETRLVWGDQDSAVLEETLEPVRQFVPNLHIVKIAGGGHFLPRELPAVVADQVRLAATHSP